MRASAEECQRDSPSASECDEKARALIGEAAQAHARLQPTLAVHKETALSIKKGARSLFTGDDLKDRAIVESALLGVAIYPNGTVSLAFRGEGLFGQLAAYQLFPRGPMNESAIELPTNVVPLVEARRRLASIVKNGQLLVPPASPARRYVSDLALDVDGGNAIYPLGDTPDGESPPSSTKAKGPGGSAEAQFSHRSLRNSVGDPSGNRTRVTGVRGRCPNR